jgi:hypothetical protein
MRIDDDTHDQFSRQKLVELWRSRRFRLACAGLGFLCFLYLLWSVCARHLCPWEGKLKEDRRLGISSDSEPPHYPEWHSPARANSTELELFEDPATGLAYPPNVYPA